MRNAATLVDLLRSRAAPRPERTAFTSLLDGEQGARPAKPEVAGSGDPA